MPVRFWLIFYCLFGSHIPNQNQAKESGISNSNDRLNETITVAENGIDEQSFENITEVDQPDANDECLIDEFRFTVTCVFQTWKPETLQSHLDNTSTVKYLKINIKDRPNYIRLTKQHLEGLSELQYLVIKGTCPLFVVSGFECPTPHGIESMDNDTFEATPNLIHLTLMYHPLTSTEALHKLKSLRYLNFLVLPNLILIPSSLDNMRGTIRSIKLNYVGFDKITSDHFKDMRELSTLEISTSTSSLLIDSGGVSNLPKLTSLYIGRKKSWNILASYNLTMGINAINNVPNLREVTLTNIRETIGNAYGCSGNFNIERLEILKSTVSIFNYCHLLLQCIKCGYNPKKYPQTILFSSSGGSQENENQRVFPPQSVMPRLNVSRLIFMFSSFSNPFSVFPQTPLLKEFIVEEAAANRRINFIPIKRLDGNPFVKLPKETRLDEARITILHCGCEVLKMIKWFEETQKSNYDKSVSDILNIECFYIDGLCAPKRNTTSNPIFQDLSFLKKKLQHICNKKHTVPKQFPTKHWSNTGTCLCEELASCPSFSSNILPRPRSEKPKSSNPILKELFGSKSSIIEGINYTALVQKLLIPGLRSDSFQSLKPTLHSKMTPVESGGIKSSSAPSLSFINLINNVIHSNSRRTSKHSITAI